LFGTEINSADIEITVYKFQYYKLKLIVLHTEKKEALSNCLQGMSLGRRNHKV